MNFINEWRRRLTRREWLVIARKNDVAGADGVLMTQWTLIGILGWNVRVHVFHRGDSEGFHSHPRGFVSVGLLGAYVEELRNGEVRLVSRGVVTVRGPSDEHRVTPIRFPCVTLAITTPVIANWQKSP